MEKTKVGLIGGGSFGEAHLIAYSSIPHVEIGGIFTRNAERRKYLCERYGGKNCYSIDELLDIKEIKVVSIVTAEYAHLEPFEKAIKKGKAIYIEKPIATNLRDVKRMVELSKDKIVMTGHLLRFENHYVRTYEEMSRYGKLRHIYMRRRRPLSMKEVYGRSHPAYNISIHDFDVANWYVGVPFKRVISLHGFYCNEPMPDYMSVLIEYENGVTVIIEGGWLLPESCGFVHNDICSVITERGGFDISIPDSGYRIYGEKKYEEPNLSYEILIYGKEYGPLRTALDYFIDTVIKGRDVEIATIEQGCEAVLLTEAAIRSANENRYVTREEMVD